MSTIKVDTIATRTGSGNITVSNNIAGAGTISGTNITATANGVPLIVNSSNSNANKIGFQDNGSAVSFFGGVSNGLFFGNSSFFSPTFLVFLLFSFTSITSTSPSVLLSILDNCASSRLSKV